MDKFPVVQNLARQHCLFDLLCGVLKSRKVQLPNIAEAIHIASDKRKLSSIIHRFEDFFREAVFDFDALAVLLFSCLPAKGKIRLCIDRTEWDFGRSQVNILMLTASCGSVQVPLYWELLENKSGNSNSTQRIELFEKIVALVGPERIGILIADREFIGHKWLKYLKTNNINFCIRVPKHHLIGTEAGEFLKAEGCLNSKKTCVFSEVLVDGVWLSAYLKSMPDGDPLFLVGTAKNPHCLPQFYKKRWQIECFFQNIKGRGFELESTQMKCVKKLKKLVGIVALASAFCQSTGVYLDEKVQNIPIKNHGYKRNSFARHGLNYLQWLLKQSAATFDQTVEKFIRFLCFQKFKYNILNYWFSGS